MSTQQQTQAEFMKATVRRWIDQGLNEGNLDVMDTTHGAHATWHGPGDQTIEGRDALKEMVRGYTGAFPDLEMTIERMFVDGDWVSVAWRVTGTHMGPLGDIPATGKPIDMRGMVHARFEGNVMVEEHELFDELAMLTQLGVMDG